MKMEFPTKNKDLNFVIHKHTVGPETEYQFSIQTDDNTLQFWNFPRTGKMEAISNEPNITRLFGSESEDTRTSAWLDYSGKTVDTEALMESNGEIKAFPGVYEIEDSGVLRIGEQTDKYIELFLKGSKLSDRWILRRVPNVFENPSLSKKDDIYLFWKPPKQKTFENAYEESTSFYSDHRCACAVKDCSTKFHELTREEGEEREAKFQFNITIDPKTKTFEGVSMAEGTWIDMYLNKYVYTPEFITHVYNKHRDQIKTPEGIPLNTLHDAFGETIDGKITEVLLVQEPIKHEIVKGIYNGPLTLSESNMGLSYEFKLRSVWNEDFQSWVPFDAITDKLSVTPRPACKICWITKVN